jgi:hypothetical protein
MEWNEMYDTKGSLTPEAMAQAMELMQKVASAVKEYHPAITLFVLEAALGAQIGNFSQPLGDLFDETMRVYKQKATILMSVAGLLRDTLDGIRAEEQDLEDEPKQGD